MFRNSVDVLLELANPNFNIVGNRIYFGAITC